MWMGQEESPLGIGKIFGNFSLSRKHFYSHIATTTNSTPRENRLPQNCTSSSPKTSEAIQMAILPLVEKIPEHNPLEVNQKPPRKEQVGQSQLKPRSPQEAADISQIP